MISGVSNLQTGAAGLVILVVVAILTGVLLPRWTVKQLIKAAEEALKLKDQQLAAKDEEVKLWRQTAENYQATAAKAIDYSTNLLTVNEVATKALHALTSSAHQGEPDEIAQNKAPSEA
jgi:hypothetical protein